jgi:hypothetical protein
MEPLALAPSHREHNPRIQGSHDRPVNHGACGPLKRGFNIASRAAVALDGTLELENEPG